MTSIGNRDRSEAGGQQDEPAPRLREPVVEPVAAAPVNGVASVLQPVDELLEHGGGADPRDVLHRDDIRGRLPDESAELAEERPVLLLRGVFPAAVRRKRSARRAADQGPDLGFTPKCDEMIGGQLAHVLKHERRFDIRFERMLTGRI